MGDLPRLWRAWAAPTVLCLTVIAFSAGSSSLPGVKSDGLTLRWVALFVLAGVAATLIAPARHLRVTGFLVLPAILLALAVLSTTWSAAPRTTFERTGTLVVLFATAAALAHASRADAALRRRILLAPAAAAALVAAAGFAMLAAGVGEVAQGASVGSSWRFRGFGESSNTVPLLAAVALPAVAWGALRERGRMRFVWVLAGTLLLATCVMTESRGGLLAAFLGTALVLWMLSPDLAQKVASVGVVATLSIGGVVLRQVEQPPPPVNTATSIPVVTTPRTQTPSARTRTPRPPSGSKGRHARGPGTSRGVGPGTSARGAGPGTSGGVGPGTSARGAGPGTSGGVGPGSSARGAGPGKSRSVVPAPAMRTPQLPKRPVYGGATALPARYDEIGDPFFGAYSPTTLGSGRVAEWEGTLHVVEQRPLLGYGFGTEPIVFVDRWYYFDGGTAENSYIGIALQLGAVGFLALIGIGLVLVPRALRAFRLLEGDEQAVAVVGLAVVLAAAALMLIQSYVYSVGNVASVTVWTAIFMLGDAVWVFRRKPASRFARDA